MDRQKLTDLAQAYHDDGADTRHTLDSVADDVIMETLETFNLDVSKREYNLMRLAVMHILPDAIDWEEIERADDEARAYDDAKRSAIYK